MVEGYSHELSSCGFWPGGGEEGGVLRLRLPRAGRASAPRRCSPRPPATTRGCGEFLLPYEAVRTAPDPDRALLAFLQSTYEAAADLGGWDRAALERPPDGPPAP